MEEKNRPKKARRGAGQKPPPRTVKPSPTLKPSETSTTRHIGDNVFDERLTQLTKALENNPNAFTPRSQPPATGEGRLDFDKDVKHAAELLVKYQEMRYKFEKKEVSSDTSRKSSTLYNHDLNRLRTRYYAISPQQG
jgi:NAD-dependent DNA ligase